jgi:voltage-gated potassium channel Kch
MGREVPTMRDITMKDRFRYLFDNTMSKGAVALILWLFVLSVVMIAAVSAVVLLTNIAPASEDGGKLGFLQIAWMGLMRTLDAGTMGGDTGSWPFLIAMFVITLGGVFIVSTLIGVLTSGIEQKMGELRKGRSFVVEQDHTIILGWSPQIFTIVSELTIANENRKKGACIAVLAEKDKVEMEDEIRSRVGSTKNTRVVCRTGSPIDLADLEIVNPHGSRSIIILPPESDDPDSQVIKTILAITNNPNRRKEPPYHVVAVIHDRKNMEVARMVGGDEVELVLAADLISRITVQTCRQSGLSVVHTELLDFGGDEIYFKDEPELRGKTLGEALHAYEDSSLIGLHVKDGRVLLNPPMDTPIGEGDRIIAISEDDDTIHLSHLKDLKIDEGAIQVKPKKVPKPERALILGWNGRAPMIISELDKYVAPGSEVTVVADSGEAKGEIDRLAGELRHQKVTFRAGDTTDRRTLDGLDVGAYDHLIVLSYSDRLGPQEADAQTLITLLHLRDMADKKKTDISIVSEMLDIRNRELAEVTRADDFIVSDRLVSLLLTQLSENKHLARVFEDIFDPEGSEIYLKPAEEYVAPGRAVNFYTVVEAARRRSEIAIGYRLKAHAEDASRQYGVVVNPDKSGEVTFTDGDKIVVVAED